MQQYDGYRIGPVIREIRQAKRMTVDKVSELTGLSNSSINQIEQGGRNLSMRSLFLLMEVYECDANTVLDIKTSSAELSIDGRLKKLPREQREYLLKTFSFMIENVMSTAV